MIQYNYLADFVGNKIFNIEFVKANGTIRTMNARLKVKTGVKGTGKTKPNHLITVFDMNANQFRCFDRSKVLSVKCNGITFKTQ